MTRFNHTLAECGIPEEHALRHDLDGSAPCSSHPDIIVANEGGSCPECQAESEAERATELAAERYFERGYAGYDYDPADPRSTDR